MLHIALAKGRIAKTVMKRLAEGGFHFSDYSDADVFLEHESC